MTEDQVPVLSKISMKGDAQVIVPVTAEAFMVPELFSSILKWEDSPGDKISLDDPMTSTLVANRLFPDTLTFNIPDEGELPLLLK